MTWKPATISALSVTDGIAIANNGEDAAFSRPPAPIVYWTGSAQPTNAQQGDVWLYNVQAGEALVYDSAIGIFKNSSVQAESQIEISPSEPASTSVLWIDTDESATQPFLVAAHGSNADFARPDADTVHWKGSVAPNNAVAGDLWYDTTGD